MNNPRILGETSRIRLRQGQLDLRCPDSILETPAIQSKHCIYERNLSLNILNKAKEFRMAIDPNIYTREWSLKGETKDEIRTRKILTTRRDTGSLEPMIKVGIWFTSQLLDKKGEDMITWKQLKSLRSLSRKGRKGTWFRELEAELIENRQTREVREEFKNGNRKNKLKSLLVRITKDQRRKE